MATEVTGEMYRKVDGQLWEIKRQLRQENGYPFDLEDLQNHLQAAIEGRFESGLITTIHELKVWKTIKLGTELKSADDFRQAIKDGGFRISYWANDIISQSAFVQSLADANREQEYDLVILTTAQLTSKKNGGTTTEVFTGADNLGLEKCPLWMGTKLRLDYPDQPMGEWLLMGMEPIADSGGHLCVFAVGHVGDDLWLDSHYGDPDFFWRGGDRWVFVRPAS